MNDYRRIINNYLSGNRELALREVQKIVRNKKFAKNFVKDLFEEIVCSQISNWNLNLVQIGDIDQCLLCLKKLSIESQIYFEKHIDQNVNKFSYFRNTINFLLQLVWYSKRDYVTNIINRKSIIVPYLKFQDDQSSTNFLIKKISFELFIFRFLIKFKRLIILLSCILIYMYSAPVVGAILYRLELKEKITNQYAVDIIDLSKKISHRMLNALDEDLRLQQNEVNQLPDELKQDLVTP